MKLSFLNHPAKVTQTVVMLAAVLAFVGCGPSIPDIVPVSGTITYKGAPYAGVEVKFYPLQKGLDGNFTASGVTDKDGKYTLVLPGKTEPGACACECAVTVTEGPIPKEVRESENQQVASTKYLKLLKNRPVPTVYNRMSDTPLKVQVTKDESTYDFELK